MIRSFFLSLRKSETGVALVEFALVIPILLMLVFGIIEFGWAMNNYIVVTGAAREGARVAVVGKNNEEIYEAVNNHLHLLVAPQIDIYRGGYGEETRVEVTYLHYTLTGLGAGWPFEFLGFFPIELRAQATMRQESMR